MIRYLKHREIDRLAWDKTVSGSACPLIYAWSWYLDNMTGEQWDALVFGNYEAVFPLPWKKKYGLKYVYQPYFCQQLGLFAGRDFDVPVTDFIKAIPKNFVLIDLQLNLAAKGNPEGRTRKNYRLDLGHPYHELVKGYNSDLRKNLRKLSQEEIKYVNNIPFEKVIGINREAWGAMNPGIGEADYKRLESNCREALKRNMLVTAGALRGPELLAAALFFITPAYLFYVSGGISEEGKKLGVMNGLIDNLVREFAGKKLTLDFEGSEIEKVAYFYSKFGSVVSPYLHFRKYNIF